MKLLVAISTAATPTDKWTQVLNVVRIDSHTRPVKPFHAHIATDVKPATRIHTACTNSKKRKWCHIPLRNMLNLPFPGLEPIGGRSQYCTLQCMANAICQIYGYLSSRWAWLVGWSLTSLFSTNTAISQMKGQGWRVILYPVKEG